ncbi:MAG TPA: hypothetical protein VJ577_12490 [Burkholderiaceae bacterium]|nr:hypothetical protein [Burkholderiaceae bacterium]
MATYSMTAKIVPGWPHRHRRASFSNINTPTCIYKARRIHCEYQFIFAYTPTKYQKGERRRLA